MKKIFCFVFLSFLFPVVAISGDLPNWVYQQSQKQGDIWLFTGSAHDVSLMNIGVPFARSAALSNMASTIGVLIDSRVDQHIEGSEQDGYVEQISVYQGYELDKVAAYGVRTKEMHTERFHDPYSGRNKFNVHVLIEVSDKDLQKAKADFVRRAMVKSTKPIMKPKKEENIISRFIRKVGL